MPALVSIMRAKKGSHKYNDGDVSSAYYNRLRYQRGSSNLSSFLKRDDTRIKTMCRWHNRSYLNEIDMQQINNHDHVKKVRHSEEGQELLESIAALDFCVKNIENLN